MGLTRREVLREAVHALEKEFDIELKATPLNSIDECMEALSLIVFHVNKDKLNLSLSEKYFHTRAELIFLKTQIKELEKKKKWYHKLFFWK